jgi:hypothetical protein
VRISNHFSRISVFNTEHVFSRPSKDYGTGRHEYYFRVNKFEYQVFFYDARDRKEPNSYIIEFKLINFYGSRDDKIDLLKQLHPDKDLSEMNFDLVDVDNELYYSLIDRGEDVLGVGNAATVLSNVVGIIKQFVEQNKPDCIYFVSHDPSRSSLYHKMLSRFTQKNMRTSVKRRGDDVTFSMCFDWM